MQLMVLQSKIHRAKVTDDNINYEGSITIDEDLMEAAGILPFQQVQIYNLANGNRFETYVLKGKRGSHDICINGAAAHLARTDDLIIIASYALLEEKELISHAPTLIYVDEENRIVRTQPAIDKEIP